MEAGRLKDLVTLQRPGTARDPHGHISSWETMFTDQWAEVLGVGARERLRAGSVGATFTHTVALRYNGSISRTPEVAGWRIVWGTRLLNIEGVVDLDNQHQWLIFQCTEGSADGQ